MNTKSFVPLLVVVLVAAATGIGALDEEGASGLPGLPAMILLGLVGWVAWASLSYLVGAKLLPTAATSTSWGAVARALAFAQAPGMLRAVGIFGEIGAPIALVTILWQFVAMGVALQETLDYRSHWRAAGVVAIGFIPYVAIVGAFNLLFGAP